jgi:integrase/recombinase XerD
MAMRLLRSWLPDLGAQAGPKMPLFRCSRCVRVSFDALHYQWAKLCLSENLVDLLGGREQPRFTLHQLRHTVGSTLIRELPEQIISQILDHRDPRSTRRYAEVTEEQVRLALAQKR